MEPQVHAEGGRIFPHTLSEALSVLFRYRQLVVLSFLGIFLGSAVLVFLRPPKYEADMKILVKNERVYPVVTAEPSVSHKPSFLVPEQDLNSEIELLRSRDLIAKVIIACGLTQRQEATAGSGNASGAPTVDSKLVQSFLSNLTVEPLGKSSMIAVSYTAPSPEQAVRVLNTLADFYLEKHSEVHRPDGTLDFFQQETERYRQELANIQVRLANFAREGNSVYPQMEKERALQRLDEFDAKSREIRTAIAEKEELVRSLEKQLASMAPRVISEVRTSDNREVIKHLKSELAVLELKRIDLLSKFEPSYRPVQEVEEQIAHLREALAREEKVTLREETSAVDPNYERLQGDLAVAKAALASLQASAAKIAQDVHAYRERGHVLYEKEIAQQGLLRAYKTADENYQLYLRKQEEARISDALDKERILNVTLTEKPTLPTEPAGPSRMALLLVSGFFAWVASTGLAFASDRFSPSFHTSDDVESLLKVPVVAALPTGNHKPEA